MVSLDSLCLGLLYLSFCAQRRVLLGLLCQTSESKRWLNEPYGMGSWYSWKGKGVFHLRLLSKGRTMDDPEGRWGR